jgi:hypothetical protein
VNLGVRGGATPSLPHVSKSPRDTLQRLVTDGYRWFSQSIDRVRKLASELNLFFSCKLPESFGDNQMGGVLGFVECADTRDLDIFL